MGKFGDVTVVIATFFLTPVHVPRLYCNGAYGIQ